MNFLAHLWLARSTRTSAAGAILGDMVHGRLERAGLPPALALGVRIHRRVDVVTDRHPLSVEWRSRFHGPARRYSGITLDLLCDHALALDWPRYAAEPLERFAARSGQALAAETAWFQRHGDWAPDADEFAALLCSYAHWSGFERALRRTAGRLRQPQRLLDTKDPAMPLLADVRARLPALLADLERAAQALRREVRG